MDERVKQLELRVSELEHELRSWKDILRRAFAAEHTHASKPTASFNGPSESAPSSETDLKAHDRTHKRPRQDEISHPMETPQQQVHPMTSSVSCVNYPTSEKVTTSTSTPMPTPTPTPTPMPTATDKQSIPPSEDPHKVKESPITRRAETERLPVHRNTKEPTSQSLASEGTNQSSLPIKAEPKLVAFRSETKPTANTTTNTTTTTSTSASASAAVSNLYPPIESVGDWKREGLNLGWLYPNRHRWRFCFSIDGPEGKNVNTGVALPVLEKSGVMYRLVYTRQDEQRQSWMSVLHTRYRELPKRYALPAAEITLNHGQTLRFRLQLMLRKMENQKEETHPIDVFTHTANISSMMEPLTPDNSDIFVIRIPESKPHGHTIHLLMERNATGYSMRAAEFAVPKIEQTVA